MSLSQKNLSSIQKAGQAAHDATEAIAATVRIQAESMVASMASQPFSVESEQAIARFKTLSRLNQGLVEIEAQLQELYAVASDLANPASDVIVVKAVKQRKNSNALAVDVEAKPVKAIKAPKAKKAGRKAARHPAFKWVNTTLSNHQERAHRHLPLREQRTYAVITHRL